MKSQTVVISLLFLVAAAYDGVLGAAFLLAGERVFDWFAVTPPNHMGYVRFPAALLIIFAIMFLAVAVRPVANRQLIIYGMLLKVCYSGMVGYYWFTTDVPMMWKPFAVADVVFLVLFAWAWLQLGAAGRKPTASAAPATAA